jgi:hypothetical protein
MWDVEERSEAASEFRLGGSEPWARQGWKHLGRKMKKRFSIYWVGDTQKPSK